MRKTLLGAAILVLAGSAAGGPAGAQAPAGPAPEARLHLPGHFSHVRLIARGDSVLTGISDVTVTAQQVSFSEPTTPGLPPISRELPAQEVTYLEVRTGDHGGRGALIGAGAGLAAGMLIMAVKPRTHSAGTLEEAIGDLAGEASGDAWLVWGGATVGLIVGLVLGSSSGTYLPIRENGQWTARVDVHACAPLAPAQPLRLAVQRSF
ncbi:MAG TPA: hypothetical protein VMS93_03345 [Candidatus Saccharimonadales bacterium]|nr:hypothetical protein [Candidatus Saccharimonadales bacterium]